MKRKDLTGLRFGRLTAIEFVRLYALYPSGRSGWKCRCDCGESVVILANNLISGCSTSCGCLRDSLRKRHGHNRRGKRSSVYGRWAAIRAMEYQGMRLTSVDWQKRLGVSRAFFDKWLPRIGETATIERAIALQVRSELRRRRAA